MILTHPAFLDAPTIPIPSSTTSLALSSTPLMIYKQINVAYNLGDVFQSIGIQATSAPAKLVALQAVALATTV
jgi:hypothetical protein